MRKLTACLTVSLIALCGCQIYPSTPVPDNTIHVMHTAQGDVAVPPTCPSWKTDVTDPYDNQPLPQFGCANARDLALTVENPDDLVQGRELGPTRGVAMVGAIRRYDNNQTRGLIFWNPTPDNSVDVTTMTTSTTPISGDVTGGASSGSSSSSSSSSGSSSSGSSGGSGP